MKIVISKTLVQSLIVIGSSVHTSMELYTQDVEQLIPLTDAEKEIKSEVKEMKKKKGLTIPLFTDIKNKVTSICSITREEEQVIIEVNEEFIEEIAELSAKAIRKTLPLALSQVKIAMSLSSDMNAFAAKWSK